MNIYTQANKLAPSNTDFFEGHMCANNEPFELTDEEYQFLLDDIEEAIADGNRKYGYGEPGYIDADGYFHPFPDNDRPRSGSVQIQKPARAIPKVDPMPPRPKIRRRRIEEQGPLLEEVMLARGMLHADAVKKEETGQ